LSRICQTKLFPMKTCVTGRGQSFMETACANRIAKNHKFPQCPFHWIVFWRIHDFCKWQVTLSLNSESCNSVWGRNFWKANENCRAFRRVRRKFLSKVAVILDW
jgi:hypothetical protein